MREMKERFKAFGKTIREKIPELVVILVCVVILGIGVSHKDGYHMDEILSFELSNAAFNPWIVPTQPQGRLAKFVENELQGDTVGETFQNLADTVQDVLKNRGNSTLLSYKADVYEEPVWITEQQFQDYITVSEKDDFNYLSVYFNVKDDNHPPLHFMLLHTMSSLFQGSVEPIVGCVINIAAVVGILILLMKLGSMFASACGLEEQKRYVGIFVALCYGLSTGAMATTLLIRMYAMLAFFCVALFVIHVKKWSENQFTQRNKGLIAVTVMGFLTQYFFLFYCLVLAAVTGVLLLAKKRTKEFFCYVRSMIIAAVIGVALFPFSISDVFSSGRGVEALDNLSQGFAGFGTRLAAFAEILFGRTFGVVMSGAIVVLVVTLAVVLFIFRRKPKAEKSDDMQNAKKYPLLCMLLIPVVGYFLLAARMSPYLVDRYVMAIFPFVILGVGLLLCRLFFGMEERFNRKGLAAVFCTLLVIEQAQNLIQYDGSYLYSGYGTQVAMAEVNADYPCICVYDGVGYYENLLEFTAYEKTLLVTADELDDRQETASIEELEGLVLLLKPNVDQGRVIAIMEEKYGFSLDKYVIRGTGVHGDVVALMSKSEN